MKHGRNNFTKETKNTPRSPAGTTVQFMTREEHTAMTFALMSDVSLLERAVRGARGRQYRKGELHPRWQAVKDVFSLGSTFSRLLCQRFDIDPDEMVKR